MGATSVTGTGLGDSNGKQRPENHITCSCGPNCEEEIEPKVRKNPCSVQYVSGGSVVIKTGTRVQIKVCS